MNVFYLCQTGKYAALLAGSFHLKKLSINTSYNSFLQYIRDKKVRLYEPYLLGEDETGKQVYIVATTMEQKLVAKIINSFESTFANKKNSIIVDSLPEPNLFLVIILKLSSFWILKLLLQKIIPFAVWLNRYKIYQTFIKTTKT